MKKIKLYALIGIVTVSYIIGMCIGFGLCATTQTAQASSNASPITTNIQSTTQSVSYDYIYVNGTRYIVFMSPTGDIEVVR